MKEFRFYFKRMRQAARRAFIVISAAALFWSLGGYIETAKGSALSMEMLRSQCLNNGHAAAKSAYHSQTGNLRFVGTDTGYPIPQPAKLPASASFKDAARGYLSVCGSLFGLKDHAAELAVKRQKVIDERRSLVRFQQVYQGIPVIAGELNVQVSDVNDIISVNGEILPDISVETSPMIDAASAKDMALQHMAKKYGFGVSDLKTTQPELWIYNPILIQHGGGFTSLVWRMDITYRELSPIRELVLIDAQRGNVALSFNQIDTAKNRETYTALNGTTLPGTLVCNESNPSCTGGDSHAVAAHTYAGDTYNFYFNYHGRDSINNAGMTLRSTVHYGSGYNNAFWNGSQMVYGDAYGYPLADDVVGHELTHGVTQYESGLFYYYQSGAINESLSDVWGEFVDLINGSGNDAPGVRWQMGEDVSGLGALRNMQNPPAFSDPDKMTSPYYYTVTCGNSTSNCDNGGVHINSGVNNKAVYLMTDGGTFNGQTVTGLDITKVAKIYYEVQTNLLTSGSDYADLYEALYQGCKNVIGVSGISISDCQEVREAALAVEMNQEPVAGYNPEAPLCPTGQTPLNLFFDDLEGGSGNWTFGALNGSSRWGYDSPYGRFAYSGLHFLYADDYPDEVSDSYAAMNASVLLPANAYLRFAHAYGFEGINNDGGVLEYSTNGGVSWFDAGSLFDYNGYDGAIAAGANPLAGRSAFLADSHGYISSRLSLASLSGQNVRFRWRMGLNSTVYDWGWWLDDVQIYTCAQSDLMTLVTWYYNSILNRVPEPGGAEGWTTEIQRIVSLGIDIKEGFIALGKLFFNSAEYLNMNSTDNQYITDQYETFLGRTPSQGEVDYWAGELSGGLTRNLLMNYFVFSEEFKSYMDGLFGDTTVRPEYNLVNDLYRGFLSRLPDDAGFNYWLAQMQTAQCNGDPQAIRDLTSQMALLFLNSQEYADRNTSNSEYIEDLYNGILRRGAELAGYQYWLGALNGGTTRPEMLQLFVDSTEFQGRVTEVINAGCAY
ncbi:MAG: DUF4214 domain-containing protein [Nitrospirae bacterium]|nr:DUF4214 domain-containing protein [Nitrospirota bacterium]